MHLFIHHTLYQSVIPYNHSILPSIHVSSIHPFIYASPCIKHPIFLSIHPSIIPLSILPSLHLCFYQSMHQTLNFSIYPSIHPPAHTSIIYLSFHPSMYPSIFLLSMHPSPPLPTLPSINPCIYPSIHLYIHPSIHSPIHTYIGYIFPDCPPIIHTFKQNITSAAK